MGVCVDNCLLGVLKNNDGSLIWQVPRANLLQAMMHSVIAWLEIPGDLGGKDPISLKKLEKGDSTLTSKRRSLVSC